MKNKNICAVLALDKIELHGNILPGSQPVAKFNALNELVGGPTMISN